MRFLFIKQELNTLKPLFFERCKFVVFVHLIKLHYKKKILRVENFPKTFIISATKLTKPIPNDMQFPCFVVLVIWRVIMEFLNPHFLLLITIKKGPTIPHSVYSNLIDCRVNFLPQHYCYNAQEFNCS